jgi:transcriptional regulator GlxA family with amidase domain
MRAHSSAGWLSRYVSPNAMTLIRAAAAVVFDCGLSEELAGIFGVNERTLGKWCTAEGLPPPRRLLAWIRVLLGAALLKEGTRSWNNAARSTGYVDASGLRRAVAGFLRPPQPGADERRSSFHAALAAFDSELHQRRPLRRAQHAQNRSCAPSSFLKQPFHARWS